MEKKEEKKWFYLTMIEDIPCPGIPQDFVFMTEEEFKEFILPIKSEILYILELKNSGKASYREDLLD